MTATGEYGSGGTTQTPVAPADYAQPLSPPTVSTRVSGAAPGGSAKTYPVTYAAPNSFWAPVAPNPVPMMPPPPTLVRPPSGAPQSVGYNSIQLAQATSPVPPAVTAPPVAQGFGTNVPQATTAVPPAYNAPAPAVGGIVDAPSWGTPTFLPSQYVKFVQSIRLRHTWLAGEADPNEFGINDSEVAATFAYPNFIFSQQPLLITPGFILHLWDPPALDTGDSNPFLDGELPPRVYSAYLDFYWTPRINERWSTELDFRIGVYSDFESAGGDAIRPQGYGAFIYQMSPVWALKGGVTYINRVDVKILPVAGLIWTPDQFTHFDITFPNPKLSHFAWRWGNTDVWWYLAAEYGGGSWEVDNIRGDGLMNGGQRVDINDIRLIGGLEWTGGWVGAKGFLEIGYVFDREVVFDAAPGFTLKPDDTVMVRGGFAF